LSSDLCKAPLVISALKTAYCHQRFAKRFGNRLLSLALSKAPIVISALKPPVVISTLQSAYFHQRFAKRLLSSAF
jgi:hypothetical protein